MKKGAGAALAALGIMAALNPGFMESSFRTPKEPKKKMPLTEEETEILASLSGKEKKQYIKTLKDKYYR